jgi:hypothetical protein
MYQLDFRREQLIQPVMHNGVGLAAADLHDRPRAGGNAADLIQPGFDQFGVAKFIYVAHG